MRSGVWLGILGFCSVVACRTSYTAPPTECDDYCTVTHGYDCHYDPAECVQRCEFEKRNEGNLDCSELRAAVVSCTQEHPDAVDLQCEPQSESPCDEEVDVLDKCNHGMPRDSAICDSLCGSLVLTGCPYQDRQSCIVRCVAEGHAAPQCRAERDAVRLCTNASFVYCEPPDPPPDPFDPMPEAPYDPEVLPCKAERDALTSCGAESSSAGAAGAGGAP